MSYQVLARKYRPKSFKTLVGQEHVVRALTHALEQQRLHHAYLFTGTRGVGKTTLSRILAKSLNCETGITANPCGQCEACLAIDAGRFVDYIEMDAASNRGVEEMAQLLEQAVYAPTNARFKVYMIDEVHMLTNHAFNAMLKTLEEPPPHIKFIIATTDPQKIPVTVLSRCLQFNLKQMPLPSIISHLDDILQQEQISFELPALRLLAQGAQGSMRDALSLTDQAIAYAAGAVTLEAVQGMLGALDQTYLIQICDALAANDGAQLLAVADQMASRSLSYKAALQDLATLLHQISIAQFVPTAIADDLPERAEILRLATVFDAEQCQLFYQIAVHGRNELGLAPDEYAGFSMTLLRMLAFRPVVENTPSLLSGNAQKSGNANRAQVTAALQRPAQASSASLPVSATVIAPKNVAPMSEALPHHAATSQVAQSVVSAHTQTGTVKSSHAKAALEMLSGARGSKKSLPPAEANSATNSASNTAPNSQSQLHTIGNVALAEKKTELTAPKPLPWEDAREVNQASEVLQNASSISANQAHIDEANQALQQAALNESIAPIQTEFKAELKAEFKTELKADNKEQAAPFNQPKATLKNNMSPISASINSTTEPAFESIKVVGVKLKSGEPWDGDWPVLAAQLAVRGVAQQFVMQSELSAYEILPQQTKITLRVPLETLLSSGSVEKVTEALNALFDLPVILSSEIGHVKATAHAAAMLENAARQKAAEELMAHDKTVLGLMHEFGATLIAGSIKPL